MNGALIYGDKAAGFALTQYVRHEFLNKEITEIDYTSVKELTINLQRVNTFVKGRLIKVEYWGDYNFQTQTGTNKVIRVDVVYVDGADNFVSERTTTRTWLLIDETDGLQTLSTKKYDTLTAIKEGVRRRNNILDELKMTVPSLIMQTEGDDLPTAQAKGVSFFDYLNTSVDKFIGVNDQQIQTQIDNADTSTSGFPWLLNDIGGGVTIRQYIKTELDYLA